MSQWRDYEGKLNFDTRTQPDIIHCSNCKCEWFEQISVSKFDGNQVSTPGQKSIELGSTHILLKCVRCNNTQERSINYPTSNTALAKSYDDLIKTLQTPITLPEEKK